MAFVLIAYCQSLSEIGTHTELDMARQEWSGALSEQSLLYGIHFSRLKRFCYICTLCLS